MSPATQVRRLIRPLLERNPDLIQASGSVLCYVPMTHFGQCIWIQNWPSRGYFLLEWRMHHPFLPGNTATLPLGRTFGLAGRSTRFKPKGQGGLFEWDDPTMPGDFVDQVEAEILPLFRSIDTLAKSVAFVGDYDHNPLRADPRWMTLMHVALGNITAAQPLWRTIMHRYDRGSTDPHLVSQHAYACWCDLTEPLLAGDRAELARLLHAWEATTVRGTKLERHWKPTPFPLETAA